MQCYEMKQIDGHASVTIRKQKQIFLFDFEMEVYFIAKRDKAEDFEGDEQEIKGKFKVHEFN